MQGIDIIKMIHAGADETCYSAILTAWGKKTVSRQAEDLFYLLNKGMDISTAASSLNVTDNEAKELLIEYQNGYCKYDENKNESLYDRMFPTDKFFKECETLINKKSMDAYFSLNSFWKSEKAGKNIRHLNAIVLDFDYYKLDQYKDFSTEEFYKKKIKRKLPLLPSIVMDSGRGIYVIYVFKHCSYHMCKLYRAITKFFFNNFKDYGIDAGAMLLTQVIRIPGTYNSKTGKQVSVIEYNETSYIIQDLSQMLPWTKQEVANYKINQLKYKDGNEEKSKTKDLSKRKPYFNDFYEDMKKLIVIRNKRGIFEGYRENLIYLFRERATWSGYSISESVLMAKELNKMFHLPLPENEVEKTCRPSDGRKNSSLSTIIDKLEVTLNEQKQLKILKKKWLKKSEYAKKKRRIKLLNITDKKKKILERRTRVCELKNIQHLSNKEISDILEVNKSTVTRDLKYIKQHPSEFTIKLKDYMDSLEGQKTSDNFLRRTTYDKQQQLLNWLKIAHTALDYLVRDLGVAKN